MLNSIISDSMEAYQAIILALVSLAGGIIFALIYSIFKKKDGYFKDMIMAYSLFPFIVTMAVVVVTLVTQQFDGTQITARIGRVGVALLSACLILRFRSEQRNFEDLTFMFLLTIFGMAVGLGYVVLALIIYVLAILVFVIFNLLGFPRQDKKNLQVSITVPESLDYPNAFNEVFEKYCTSYSMVNVKSTDLGSVFIVKYNVMMRDEQKQKEFLDEIRTRNANLNITICMNDFKSSKK